MSTSFHACSDAAAGLHVRDVQGDYRPANADEVLRAARRVLGRRVQRGCPMSSSSMVRDFLHVQLGAYEHEVFAVLFLDAQVRMLGFKEMFRGTLTQTSVYPREVAKEALLMNAASVVLAHNHPSGEAEPSRADEHLTNTLKAALALLDIRVLDHIVVAGDAAVSFAERGLV